MKRCCLALGCLAIVVMPASAHFIWIIPEEDAPSKSLVRVIFSDNLEPDKPELLAKIGQTELFVRDAEGKSEPVKWIRGSDAYQVDVPGSGPRAVAGVCKYGVVQRGKAEPCLLNYYPKTLLGGSGEKLPSSFYRAWDRLALEILPVEKTPWKFQVRWQGKPLTNAAVTILASNKDKALELKTGDHGLFEVPEAARTTALCGMRVLHVEAKEGDLGDKKYKEARHYATLVVQAGGEKEKAASSRAPAGKVEADPEATKLLAEARAARAQWPHFPGFSADLEVNLDGKISRGHVQVNHKGKVELELADSAAQAWAKRILGSIVGHRLDNSAAMNTPCAFADADKDHPLGRAIRVLNDEFHSSYRIRDRQILVVNRNMGDVRFTITVLENQHNEEKQFLPTFFIVNTWDLKTGALRGSEAEHQTWQRVGKFDLPASTTIVNAGADKQDARTLKLSNYQLNASPEPGRK